MIGNEIFQENLIPQHKSMWWRRNIYNCGIIGLFLSGVLDSNDFSYFSENEDLPKEVKHEYLIGKLDNVDFEEDSFTLKIQHILRVCLSYNADQRIKFSQLYNIMKKIKNKSYTIEMLRIEVENYRKENK